MTGSGEELGTGKGPGIWKAFKGNFTLGDQKHIQEANFDAGSGNLPTAPGSAWMMSGKRGARHSFAYMQMRPATAVQKPPLLGAASSATGAAFICLLSLGRKKDRLARASHQAHKDTESSQPSEAGGAKS